MVWDSSFELGAVDVEWAWKRATERIGELGKMPDSVRNEKLNLFSLSERRLRNALIKQYNRENARYKRAV